MLVIDVLFVVCVLVAFWFGVDFAGSFQICLVICLVFRLLVGFVVVCLVCAGFVCGCLVGGFLLMISVFCDLVVHLVCWLIHCYLFVFVGWYFVCVGVLGVLVSLWLLVVLVYLCWVVCGCWLPLRVVIWLCWFGLLGVFGWCLVCICFGFWCLFWFVGLFAVLRFICIDCFVWVWVLLFGLRFVWFV